MRQWRHKNEYKFQFWQTTSQSGKTWDRGIWAKNLKQLASGKASTDISIIVRSKHILDRRTSLATMKPTKGKGFYPFEEEIVHNIDQALVLGSTGISASFYRNAYVKMMFERYGGEHKMYSRKLCRLLRCANDTLTMEVRHDILSEKVILCMAHNRFNKINVSRLLTL